MCKRRTGASVSFSRLAAVVTVVAAVLSSPTALSAQSVCKLSTVEFVGAELDRALQSFNGSFAPDGLQTRRATLRMGPSERRPGFKNLVADLYFDLEFDAQPVFDGWTKKISEHAGFNDGCSSRQVGGWARAIEGARLRPSFTFTHYQHECGCLGVWVNGSCWGRTHNTRIAEIEGSGWQYIAATISDEGRSVQLSVADGGTSDNVPDWIKGALNNLAQVIDWIPVIRDFKIDDSLRTLNDGQKEAVDALRAFRLLGSNAIPKGETEFVTLDLVAVDARFRIADTVVLDLSNRTSADHPPSDETACLVLEQFEQIKQQGERIGPMEVKHIVARGESLWSIARDYYGSERYYPLIAAANDFAGKWS